MPGGSGSAPSGNDGNGTMGQEYKGLVASCPNEGEDFYRVA